MPQATLLRPKWSEKLESNATRPSGEDGSAWATFVRSVPKYKEPKSSRGFGAASPEVKQRWRDDKYRFPVYQYARSNLVEEKGKLRPLTSRERAVRLGYRWSHCEEAVSRRDATRLSPNLILKDWKRPAKFLGSPAPLSHQPKYPWKQQSRS